VDLYSTFIVGSHLRCSGMDQFYLQITPCLPLPRRHSPNGATTECDGRQPITPLLTPNGWKAESA